MVNDLGQLIGRITVDDVMEVIKEEAEKTIKWFNEDVESSDSIWTLTRARLPWLLIGMIGGLLGAKVIGILILRRIIKWLFSSLLLLQWVVMLEFNQPLL